DALLLEDAKSLGERPGADSRARALELGETARSFGQVVDDHLCPLGPDDVGRTGDRAAGVMDRTHRAHVLIVLGGGPSPTGAGCVYTLRAPMSRTPCSREV